MPEDWTKKISALLAGLCCLVAFVTIPSCRGKECEKPEALEQARRAFAEKKYEDVYALYEEVARACPKSGEALINLGVLDLMSQRYDKAIERFSSRLRIEPSDAGTWRRLAEACMRAKRYGEAARAYGRAYELTKDLSYRELEGQAALSAGDRDKARGIFESVLLEDPLRHGALFFLGNIHREGGALDKAARFYEAAIRIKPAMVEAYINLASIRYGEGRYEDAVGLLEKAMKEVPLDAPGDPMVRYNLGLAYLKLGDKDKAVENFRRFLALSPEGKNAKEVRETLARLGVKQSEEQRKDEPQ